MNKLLILLTAATLAACGNGGSEAPTEIPVPPLVPPSNQPTGTVVPVQTVAVSGGTTMLDHFIVTEISKTVPGKTDYSLSPIFCNRGSYVQDQQIKMTYSDANATILKDTIKVGSSSFGQCKFNPSDAAQLRLDDAAALDKNKIALTVTAEKPLSTNPVQMIKVDFYKIQKAATHPALLPLGNQYPTKGDEVLLKAIVRGNGLTLAYQLLREDGSVLLEGGLGQTNPNSLSEYQAVITVPQEKFIVSVASTSSDGQKTTFITDIYKPQSAPVKLTLLTGVIKTASQTLTGTVSGWSNDAGNVLVRIHLPVGYTANWTSKTIQVGKESAFDEPIKITAPAIKEIGKSQIFIQYKYPQSDEAISKLNILTLE